MCGIIAVLPRPSRRTPPTAGQVLAAFDGLAADTAGRAALAAFTSIQVALSALDRLEVRGRDSAGIHLLVTDHGLDLHAPDIKALLAARSDPLFTSMAVATPDGHLS